MAFQLDDRLPDELGFRVCVVPNEVRIPAYCETLGRRYRVHSGYGYGAGVGPVPLPRARAIGVFQLDRTRFEVYGALALVNAHLHGGDDIVGFLAHSLHLCVDHGHLDTRRPILGRNGTGLAIAVRYLVEAGCALGMLGHDRRSHGYGFAAHCERRAAAPDVLGMAGVLVRRMRAARRPRREARDENENEEA